MTQYAWVELNKMDHEALNKVKDEAQNSLHRANQLRVQTINTILWAQDEIKKVWH